MLRVTSLDFRYRREGPLTLQGISFSLEAGEWLGIVGASGSGKSTLARCLCGLLVPERGEIRLCGIPFVVGRARARRRPIREVQMLFQDPTLTLPPHLSVGIPLRDASRHAGGPEKACQKRLQALLERLQLPPSTLRRRPRELSGGQRQRVALLRALIPSPRVLILDEPTSALDLATQSRLMELLKEVQGEEARAHILITHDMGLALSHCTRILVMEGGRIVEEATSDALWRSPAGETSARLLAAVPASHPRRRRWIADWSRDADRNHVL